MAWRYQGDQDGVEHWDGHRVVVEREGYPGDEHPDDLWHWSIEHPPTCELTGGEYLGEPLRHCCFSGQDPCWEGTAAFDEWPPGLPKVDGLVAALGTRLDVYRHWERGDEIDLWWLAGPVLDPGVDAPPIPRSF